MAAYNHEVAYLTDPGFSRVPMHPKEYADFAKRARILLNSTPLDLDLIIQNVSFNHAEHAMVSPHIGDTYSTLFFGKLPVKVSVTAILPDYTDDSQKNVVSSNTGQGEDTDTSSVCTNYGKETLLSHYKNRLRLAAVARTKVVPVLSYKDTLISGPWIGMSIVESSVREDHIVASIQILAFQIDMGSNTTTEDSVHIDYTSGMLHLKSSTLGTVTTADTAKQQVESKKQDTAKNTNKKTEQASKK